MSDLPPDYFTKPIAEVDPEIARVLEDEARRQETTLEMIASENFVPQALLEPGDRILGRRGREARQLSDRFRRGWSRLTGISSPKPQ